MGIEGMNSVSSSYAGQGSQKSVTTAASVAATSGAAKQSMQEAEAAVYAPTESAAKSMQNFELADSQNKREEGQASNEQIRQAVDKINKNAQNEEAIFGIHEDTNRVTIKIVDKKTKEVIKEFPPDKTLDMIAKVWEMAGIMVDERR